MQCTMFSNKFYLLSSEICCVDCKDSWPKLVDYNHINNSMLILQTTKCFCVSKKFPCVFP